MLLQRITDRFRKRLQKMKLDEKLQAVYDYWKPNRYSLKPYLIS